MIEPSRPRVDDLWSRFASDGTLDADEERELMTALAADETLAAELIRDERLQGTLSALGRVERDGAAFARQFTERVAAERDVRRFVSKVDRRVRAELPARRQRRVFLWLAVPAAAVLALAPFVARRKPATRPAIVSGGTDSEARPAKGRSTQVPPAGAIVATVERVQGEAFILDRGRKQPARTGAVITVGQGLFTVGRGSNARIAFADRTSLEVRGDSAVGQIDDTQAGKGLFVARGSVDAQVAPQPPGRPMIISTPHAEATVLGTRLALLIGQTSTRLEVLEGRVSFARHVGGEPVVVESGQYSLAAEDKADKLQVGSKPRGSALLVVGSLTLSTSDQLLKERVESLGFEVLVRGGGAPDVGELHRAAVVLISSTVNSVDVLIGYRELPVPVVVWEPWVFDDLGMTGAKEDGDCDAENGTGEAVIKNPAHPIAAQLSGTVQLQSGSLPKGKINFRGKPMMSWGIPGPHAQWIATWPGRPERAVAFAYERGAAMPGMPAAPARRVGLFLWDDTPQYLTEAGWSLFDAAVLWSVEEPRP